MDDTILRCFDRWGREIVVMANQWDNKILLDHGEMDGHLDAVEQTLVDPYRIMRDSLYPRRESFYRRATLPGYSDRDYLKVCVEFRPDELGGTIGFVITTYPTPWIKKGETQKWP